MTATELSPAYCRLTTSPNALIQLSDDNWSGALSPYRSEFTTGQVCRAAGITNAALQSWIRRGFIIGQNDSGIDMPGRPGVRRAFSFFNLMEVAVAAALIEIGASPAQAFRAAARFAHSGDEDRNVALPFPAGRTLVVLAGDRSHEVCWTPGTDPLAVIRHVLGRPAGFIVLDVSDVFDRAMAAVGLHPEAVKEAGYRRDA